MIAFRGRIMKRKALSRVGIFFALPWAIGFLVFVLYPLAASLFYGFTDFNIFKAPNWVGLENFKNLFHDELFWKSLGNTAYMTFVGSPLYIVFGLFTAQLLNLPLKGRNLLRTIFYIPYVIPLIASALLWIWVLNPQSGLLNGVLQIMGIKGPNWLANPAYTKPSLLLIGLWRSGPIMVIFLAALQDVPAQLHEAAKIDGAGSVRRFLHVTLPALTPAILFQAVMQMVLNLQYFTEAFIVIGSSSRLNENIGGPMNSLLFYAIYLYHNAFTYLKMGKASAMAWLLFLIISFLTWALFRSSRRWVHYGD